MMKVNAMKFTEDLQEEEDCRHWFNWFKNRGIPAAIILEGAHFSVWRQGTVGHKRSRDGAHYVVTCGPERIDEEYHIVEKCNGFELSV
jgi:hypothetical protein